MSIVLPNFTQIGGFLYFGGNNGFKMATIANRNGRNMVQHVLLPVNIHFHWIFFIFEFLTISLIFILAAILKILKTKSTTLIDDLFLCQVSKGSAVWSEFNYGGYSYKVSWSLMKGIQFFVNPPFLFPWQLRQSLSNRFRFC